MKLELPFEIGDKYYSPLTYPSQVTHTCTVCAGAKKVTVVDGYGKSWEVECEACGKGFEGPTGCETGWQMVAGVDTVTIAGVERFEDDKIVVKATSGRTYYFSELHRERAAALAVSEAHQLNAIEANNRNAETRNKHHRQQAAWSVRYHNDRIKEHEEKIAWHRTKVQERKP